MGFRDYYRQFDDIDEAALNLERRERRRQEKAAALARAPDIDLSGTEWPDLPHSEIVNAAIARARGFVQRYPDRHATSVRRLLADRHGLSPDQIALGNGAAELLHSAALALLSEGDELVTPWPSYPLYPLMAAHAGATPVSVEDGDIPAAVTDRTKAIVICNPNDPTGSYLSSSELRELLDSLPEHVGVLLDEALVHFQSTEDVDACLRLVEEFPRLLVVRTFSKIYGLSGLRAGYAVSSDSHLLAAVAPVLGINALTQAAVEYALRTGDPEIERRRAAVAREREVLTDQLRELGVDVTESQANFLWIRVRDMSGDQLANALRKQGVIVAPGGPLGEDHHIRAAIRDEPATNRLLRAIENAL
ncbi:MAG TPA: aminotransferase class I/II-fold pyridoxal phosphate-dependent enzyme [Thermoleophilaceae bacterium]